MFIINLTYKVPLEKIDEHLTDHVKYLEEQYANGIFKISGRKIPRTGGVILTFGITKDKLLKVIEKDPFKIHDLAEFEIIEFSASKVSEDLDFLRENQAQ